MATSSVRNWFAGVWRDATLKIDIEEHHGGGEKLLRQMGLFSVILFTITQAVGSGILTTPGIIARDYAGPYAYLSFLWAGLICAPPALCLARMAGMTSKSGSTGSYACLVLGQFVGLLMFVDVMMECIGGTAAVAVSQSDHIKMIVRLISQEWLGMNFQLSDTWTKTPEHIEWWPLGSAIVCGGIAAFLINTGRNRLTSHAQPGERMAKRTVAVAVVAGGGLFALAAVVSVWQFFANLPSINLLSIAVVAAVTGVLLRGVKETAFLTNLFTVTKLITLSAIVYFLARHYDPANLQLPAPADLPGPLAGASVAFFAFVGLDLATTMAGETKNSQRNVPLGMLIGLVCVTVLYFVAAYFLAAAVPYDQLGKGGEGEAAPMVQALEILGYKQAAIWVGLASTLALVSVVLASAYSTTRLMYNMAQHGMLPKAFEQVSAKRQVPVLATLVVGGGISLLTGLMVVGELMHLTNIGTMTAFITISTTVLVKTIRETEWRNGKQAAFGVFWVVVSVLGVIGPFRLMIELPWEAFVRLFVVWGLVTVLFVTYSRKHSIARKQLEDKDKTKKK